MGRRIIYRQMGVFRAKPLNGKLLQPVLAVGSFNYREISLFQGEGDHLADGGLIIYN